MESTVTIESITKALEEAKAALATAEAEAAEKAPAFMSPLNLKALALLQVPVDAATKAVAKAEAQMADFTKASRWESFTAQRDIVQTHLNGLIKARPRVPVVSVKGRITVVTEEELQGDATVQVRRLHVSLTPTLEKADLDIFESQIAEALSLAAWDEAGIDDVSIVISGIGTDNKLTVSPTASLNAAGKAAAGTGEAKAGALEYHYNGEWLGTRAFLAAVKESGHAFVTDNPASFATPGAWDGSKEGMSNLGKRAAKAMGVESRNKPKAE